MNKTFITSSLIMFLIIPIFGINFLFSFIGNLLLIIILVPILFLIIALLSLNSFKTQTEICTNCGSAIISGQDICINCGKTFNKRQNSNVNNDASKTVIEIEAEEVK